MKAVVRDRYGSPEVLELREFDKPVVKDTTVLVRVRASSLNSGDLDSLYGRPLMARGHANLGLRSRSRRGPSGPRARGAGEDAHAARSAIR